MEYSSLVEAEAALHDAQMSIGDRKLAVAQIVKSIRAGRLFTEHMSQKTGQNATTLDEYLIDRSDDFRRLTGLGPRAIRTLLKVSILFIDELDIPEDLVLQLGEHATILAAVANMGRDLVLKDDDAPTKTGGTLLGRYAFLAQVRQVLELVSQGQWRVRDTKELVDSLIGKASTTKGSWRAEAIPIGDSHARIQRLVWEDGDGTLRTFLNDDLWLLDDLAAFATQSKVRIEGIEGLADAHCH